MGHKRLRHVFKDGVEINTATVDEAVANGIAYVTEDRKRYGLNLIGSIFQHLRGRAGQFARWGVIDRNREYLTLMSTARA